MFKINNIIVIDIYVGCLFLILIEWEFQNIFILILLNKATKDYFQLCIIMFFDETVNKKITGYFY